MGYFYRLLGSVLPGTISETAWDINEHAVSMVRVLRANTIALREYRVRRELKEKTALKILTSKGRKLVAVSREGER